MTNRRHTSRFANAMTTMALAAVMLQTMTGCSRRFWREQAEADTYRAISEKQTDERWQLPRIDLAADSRSRFHDPYDPDCAPLPPDDPAAHAFMHQVSGREGYKGWHDMGDTVSVENPNWLAPYTQLFTDNPVNSHNQVNIPRVNLRDSLELTYIHSREFQTQIENVYLSALDLTEQRFLLGARFHMTPAGAGGVLFNSALTKDGRQARSTGLGVTQLLPAGGQFSVDLLNTVTWNLGSGGVSATSLAWEVSQPLLRQAGRKIRLESLTQAERNLLYIVRNMARFRQTIFTDVSLDYLRLQLAVQNIFNQQNNIRQLEEQIEIGQVADSWNPGVVRERLSEFPVGAEIPESLRSKFKYDGESLVWNGLLSEEQKADLLAISSDPKYQSAVQQLIRWRENQVVSLSVSQLVTRLNTAQNQLESARRQLADQLDSFKIRLGLPPDIQMSVDDTFLRPFELIDNQILSLADELKDFAKEQGPSLIPAPPGVRTSERLPPEYSDLKSYIANLKALKDKIQIVGLDQVQSDFTPIRNILAETADDITGPTTGRQFRNKAERDRVIRDVARDLRLYRLNEGDFKSYATELELLNNLLKADSEDALVASLDKNSDQKISQDELPDGWSELPSVGEFGEDQSLTGEEFRGIIRDAAVQIREELLQITQSLEVVQAGLRVEAIALNSFVIPGQMETPSIEQVVQIALENRHDLMNARGAVMDSRRAVEIAANALKARLDVRVSGESGIDGKTNSDDTNVSIDFKTPIDQVVQRNDYNAALIDYQRARRIYMAAEDAVKQSVRSSWRQLRVSEQRLEIDRQTVRNAALQYDNVATGVGQNNSLSLLNALDAVLNAQNALVGDWVTYESNRLNIFRDMGIMEINAEGVWEDKFYLADGPSVTDTFPSAEVLTQELLPPQIQPTAPTQPVPPQIAPPALATQNNE
ncbi:MAG: TolC family protein [Fuerstiella sp.]